MPSKFVVLGASARALFGQAGQMGKLTASISNDTPYASYIEEGTKLMAPQPMVGPYLAEYRDVVESEIIKGLVAHPTDLMKGMAVGIDQATMIIIAAIEARTAVDTERLKRAWTATLTNGRRFSMGPVITAEQQRAIRLARTHAKKARP